MGYVHHRQPTFWENVNNKVHTGVKTIATMKGIWDTGKAIYTGLQIAAPYMEGIASAAALL